MKLIVYDEAPGFDLKPVEADLSTCGIELDVRPSLPRAKPAGRSRDAWLAWMAWHTAFAKVRNLDTRPVEREPAGLEIRREREALEGEISPPGPIYDGPRLMEAYHGPLPEDESVPGKAPVLVLTDRLVGTFEGDRYHVRFLVTGHPTIVSWPGFVDGPARDRAYYFAKQALGSSHDANAMVDDDRVTRGDDRLTTCVASALLQAARYHELGRPFCENEGCRLFNPHWQAELIGSMATRERCERHETWTQP